MCGIAGIIDISNGFATSELRGMSDVLRHRGPDDEGFYLAGESDAAHYRGDDSDAALNELLRTDASSTVYSRFEHCGSPADGG